MDKICCRFARVSPIYIKFRINLIDSILLPANRIDQRNHQQLTEHLDQRFTIAELSKQYLINTSTLKEIFKTAYGQPIATYMKEFRVRQAMKLLREINDTIADIASQVSYQTQGKFSSAFQSIVKISPREYRKIQGIAPSDFFSKTL